MPTSPARFILVAAVMLSACQGKSSDAPAAPSAAATPSVNYWDLIAPLVAGSYGGQCLRPPNPAPFPGPIVIAPGGKVSAGNLRGDMRSADISLSSAMDDEVPTAAVNAGGGEFTLMLADKGVQRGLTAMVANGDQALACEQATVPASLHGLNVYALLARVIDTSRRPLSCIPTGALKNAEVMFALEKGILSLDAEQFDIGASRRQSALFTDGLSKLFYSATLADGRLIKMNIDAHGQLAGLEGKGRNDQLYVCK